MERNRRLIESAGFADLAADAQVMLEITYRMKKENVTAESYVEVPVDGKRAKQIVRTVCKDYPAIKRFLQQYVGLQGYDTLTWFSVDFALVLR